MKADVTTNKLALVVRADPMVASCVGDVLTAQGYTPVQASSLKEALAAATHNHFVFSVVDLDGTDDLESLQRLKAEGAATDSIIVLAGGTRIAETLGALSLPADCIVRKPFTARELEGVVNTALGVWSRRPADDTCARLQQELALWQSPRMREVRDIIEHAAGVNVTILITGETGTGKDLVARAVHELSARHGGPFVKVNCAALPRELLESELFGHERGAFTGAHQLKLGKFESANRGSIFLDEVGDLHPALQGKLMHVLQDGQFSRVGGRSTIKVDTRVLAATNQDLEGAVTAGQFREDLFYRLNVIQVHVPPLRERSEEIPLLAEYFMQRYSALFGRDRVTLAAETVQRLVRHRFPGNVRELENVIKRMIVLGDPDLRKTALSATTSSGAPHKIPGPARTTGLCLKDISRKAAQVAEREAILQALEQTRWNRIQAAKLLGISYRALLYKIKEAGLDRQSARWPSPP
jgi:two-component system, NtrC family, response regulator AtoC